MMVWLAPSAFHPATGGVEELTLQLAREYRRRGHEVVVVVHRHPATLPERSDVDGIPVVRIPLDLPGSAPLRLASYPLDLSGQVRALSGAGRPPDVIHIQCAANQLPAMATYARLRRIPLIVTTQGEVTMDAGQIYHHSIQMRTALRLGARAAAAVTACSRRAADDAARIARPFTGCQVVPNGVDPAQWTPTPLPPEPAYATWGRHVPQKGFDLLLQAFARVREQVPDAVLRIGGQGEETARLRALAGAGVEFIGPLDRAGVHALLERSRIAVVPSRLEPFGIVAVEAMAAGRGVVWSTNGGLADATGGIGWGVDPNATEAFAAALVAADRAPVDPAIARRHAETLSWTAIGQRYLDIYRAAGARG